MKIAAPVVESCQAPKMATLPGAVMRVLNLLAEMESNTPLRLHEPPHFFKLPTPPPTTEPQPEEQRRLEPQHELTHLPQ